jgi:mono/diheme cytochrome c family protein
METLKLSRIPVLFALAVTAGCQATSNAPANQAIQPGPSAFVEAACGGCHGVEPPYESPNQRAPTFESIANRLGVTKATIRAWLVNAHNYPEVMDFDLERDHVDEVADYMITLRRRDYVPAP